MGKRGPKKGARFAKTLRKERAFARLMARKELADDRWAEEVLQLALQDVRTFYDADGNLLPVTSWTVDQGRLVAGMEVVIKNAAAGDGHTDRVLKLKHWDKLRALELWGKYRNLLIERHDIRMEAGDSLLAALDRIKARNRAK